MKWFNKIFNSIKSRINKTLTLLKDNSDVAVLVTAQLKKFVEGKTDNFIASAIPGVKDDLLVALLERVIPPFAEKVAIAHEILKASKENKDVPTEIAKYILTLNNEMKEEFYAKFAARLVLDIAEAKKDGKFTFAEAMAISQIRFLELKEAGLL